MPRLCDNVVFYMDVPRLKEERSDVIRSGRLGAILLHLSLLQVVHINVDSIYYGIRTVTEWYAHPFSPSPSIPVNPE